MNQYVNDRKRAIAALEAAMGGSLVETRARIERTLGLTLGEPLFPYLSEFDRDFTAAMRPLREFAGPR